MDTTERYRERFFALTTPQVSDALEPFGVVSGLVGIRSAVPRRKVFGPAFTVARQLNDDPNFRDAADFVDTWLAGAPELENGQTFFVGAADALATKPLAELIPQFFPGTEELAAGLTGHAPAFSIAKAASLLGWRPSRSWRTELSTDQAVLIEETDAS